MVSDKEKWISVMIVPEDGAVMRKWRISSKRFLLMKTIFWMMCFFVLAGIVSIGAIGVMYSKLNQYRRVNEQLFEATSKLNAIAARLDRYEVKEQKLRAILGSDLELPKPMAAETARQALEGQVSTAQGRLNELELAIVEQELKSRKMPTLWPVDAWQISKEFVYTGVTAKDHNGIDILAPSKSVIVASADGRVTFAGVDDGLGVAVFINHENDFETRYGHLYSLMVEYGDYVRKGQQIGVHGGAGKSSTGEHLHFAIYYRGQPVNPLDWLDEKSVIRISAATQ